jgi:hypothetical protein
MLASLPPYTPVPGANRQVVLTDRAAVLAPLAEEVDALLLVV